MASSSVSHDSTTRLLEQCRISPSASVTTHPASLPLTFFDLIWLRHDPVERLFLYPFPAHTTTATFIESYLPNLKSSLSLTLRYFYPLAGRLRLSPGSSAHQYELHYAEGDSVLLTVAETDLDFLDLAGSHARESHKFRSLVPPLPEPDGVNTPLLAVQVTVFPNRGVGFGVTVHHVACDGTSSVHFIKSWASSCKSGGRVPLVGDAPSFDRSVIADPCNLSSEFLGDGPAPPAAAEKNGAGPFGLQVRATFTLGPDHIEGLKKQLESSFSLSTFVVTCAYMWSSIAKARGGSYRADMKDSILLFMVNWRKRLQPPAPDAYFGNCVGPSPAEVKVSDLVRRDGIAVAAEAIGRAIQGLEGSGVSECLLGFHRKCLPVLDAGCPGLAIAGSPKFRVYEVDFGWGRPLKVEMTSIDTRAISLSESREVEGGVEVGVALPKHEMEALQAHFEDGLKLLSE